MISNFVLLASEAGESSGIGFNTDILETNVINLVIVVAFLVYAGRGFLGKILSARLESIQSAISDAEKRQKEATDKLAVQQGKLAQAKTEADNLRKQAETDAKSAADLILATVDADIARLRESADQEIATEQERVIVQLRQQVADKALANVQAYFDRGLSESTQIELIDRSIALLSSD
ncbi:MAG: F0F1 ATP synthase subunit B [Pseudanabaena sp.]|jgi:F-type H+-transporting ATPase subunit b|uniref:F0F1 ATP synthase subunit B n=1 Tax=Pseudanabaena sp. UWO311 TaxID=2487337 RepID=UPI00115B4850|nr:F0F1 ATP synthase subunit B [Pseudanabaena sp. UWO311]MCA6503138.1 F0F1 ATP synthase subunit B [Pseudanabaena sp. M090S1SP2A07QC]MCA6506439.1 F0F1 ATP synthase subunit B [Pseudanabaena sp. M172S2SP2A07QC]MCA6510676.1 F0F1 ATP synthase subunit B [Pseudanabaena sp. M109S1SP2A07QC]MCA6520143.1 F0F1 ATP synthase subunit B [Pseudanabaena sp. M110S1SP2A07QC]MCA6523221.1 F0F1 ATP synthase subunit B [Pseudanabaena sp. M051S1SP2A07QC]MCA6526493.1 F0F1 ATP synthase subunit B [Pseudanabaena sp. M179S